MDSLLEKLGIKGIKYEDLNYEEKDQLNQWYSMLEQSSVSIDDIKRYIQAMKASVEGELSQLMINTQEDKMKDAYLKARVRNYVLLEAYLLGADKAREMVQKQLKLK